MHLLWLFQHVIREGWVKRRSAPKLKRDHDEKGPTPPSHQQQLKLERQVTKTASELHEEQHLRI